MDHRVPDFNEQQQHSIWSNSHSLTPPLPAQETPLFSPVSNPSSQYSYFGNSSGSTSASSIHANSISSLNSHAVDQQHSVANTMALSEEQRQQLLVLLNEKWMAQQNSQSLTLPPDVLCNSIDGVNMLQSITNAELLARNCADTPDSSRLPEYPVAGGLFGSNVYTPTSSFTSPSSESLLRTAGDLGAQMCGFPLNLGALSNFQENDVNHMPSNIPQNPGTSTLFSNSVFSDDGFGTAVPSHSNHNDDNIVRNLIKNTSDPALLSTLQFPSDSKPIGSSELLTPGQEISGYSFDDLHKAPGTPLSQTPPPRKPNGDTDGTAMTMNAALKSPDTNLIDSQNNNYEGTNNSKRNNSNKKKNKKNKNGIDVNNHSKAQPEGNKAKVNQDMRFVIQQQTENCNKNFSFYSSDKIAPPLLNWIAASEKGPEKDLQQHSSVKNVVDNKESQYPRTTVSPTNFSKVQVNQAKSESKVLPPPGPPASQNSKPSLSNKLSYSDVLNSSKNTSQNSNSVTSFKESNSVSGQKSKIISDNSSFNQQHGSSSLNSSGSISNASYFGSLNKRSASASALSSSQSSNNLKSQSSSKYGISFGSKVGLDEFSYPTLDEINATVENKPYNSNKNAFNFMHSIKFSDNVNGCDPSSSLPTSPLHSKKKMQASAILNNNNKEAPNQKQALKKPTFINNNLNEPVSSPSSLSCDSDGGGDNDEDHEDSSYDCYSAGVRHNNEDNTEEEPLQSQPKVNSAASNKNARTGASQGSSVRSRSGNNSAGRTGTRARGNGGGNKRRKDSVTGNDNQLLMLLKSAVEWIIKYLLFAMNWLYVLVTELLQMSSALFLQCWTKACASGSVYLKYANVFVKKHWNRFTNWIFKFFKRKEPKGSFDTSNYLQDNIQMPTTGEEAMRRLLECKGRDNYSILGVTPQATQEDIRRYYLRQAFLVHPDKNKVAGAEEAFKVLAHAFEEIGEKAQRDEYDKRLKSEHRLEEAWTKLADLLKDLEKKVEEASNMIKCTNCNGKHRRKKIPDRPVYAARCCSQCKIRHPAKEGDIWAETRMYGLKWQYCACMDGAVYDISEWAACQSTNLKQLKANTHTVQYRIVAGKKKPGKDRRDQHHHHQQQHDLPTDPEIEEFFNQICREKFQESYMNSSPSTSGSHPSANTTTSDSATNTPGQPYHNYQPYGDGQANEGQCGGGGKRKGDHRSKGRSRR